MSKWRKENGKWRERTHRLSLRSGYWNNIFFFRCHFWSDAHGVSNAIAQFLSIKAICHLMRTVVIMWCCNKKLSKSLYCIHMSAVIVSTTMLIISSSFLNTHTFRHMRHSLSMFGQCLCRFIYAWKRYMCVWHNNFSFILYCIQSVCRFYYYQNDHFSLSLSPFSSWIMTWQRKKKIKLYFAWIVTECKFCI